MKMNQQIKTTMSLAAALLAAGSINAATISVGDSLIPAGLVAGDTFHLVFGTDKDLSSASDINAFNTYANNIANNLSGNTGSIVATIGATWTVIGSGVTDQTAYNAAETIDKANFLIDAKDNSPISATVYLIGGEKVADDFADMWDGSVDTAIDLQEDGTTAASGVIHTGSNSDGTISLSRSFGVTTTDDGRINRGLLPNTNTSWIAESSETDRSSRSIYVISEAITVVPEPTTTALLGLGGLALILRRRK
jgi:hypothetical protein